MKSLHIVVTMEISDELAALHELIQPKTVLKEPRVENMSKN